MTTLVERACGARHGVVAVPVSIPPTAADPPGVVHASVSRDDDPVRSAGGGAARTTEAAATAAVAEAIERFAAVHAVVPMRPAGELGPGVDRVRLSECSLHARDQIDDPAFPHPHAYPRDEWLGEVFDLATNEPCWAPAALVSLTDEHGPLATSSGLAAGPTAAYALLRALQELVERDAYVTTWLHQLGGREIDPGAPAAEFARLGGTLRSFDLTPAFSPHPVALVAGSLPLAGRPRPSVGIACRATWDDAVEKAYLECCQGVVFVGHRLSQEPALVGLAADRVTGFDEHAVFYGANPSWWDDVPLWRFASPAGRPPDSPAAGRGDAAELRELVDGLAAAGVRTLYRDLTTVECNQLGLRVVRVIAPALTPLHHDHRWPFLGGRTADIAWRDPDAGARAGGRSFPSPFPHALG